MDVEKIAVFVGVSFALAVGAFVLWGPSPKPRRRGQITGITNLGYTCFLNSLLQALSSCPTFYRWLYSQQDKTKPGSFSDCLMKIVNEINGFADDVFGDISPIELMMSLGPLWNFAPGHQDAHELFHVFLSALQAELQTSCRKGCLSDALPSVQTVVTDMKGSGDPFVMRSVSCNDISTSGNGLENSDTDEEKSLSSQSHSVTNVATALMKPGMIIARSSEILCAMNGHNEAAGDAFKPWSSLCTIPSNSIPSLSNNVHPFSGLLTSQLKCTECKWKGPVRYDKFETVSLPLPPGEGGDFIWRKHSLLDLLCRLVSSEVINDVQCDGCNIHCPAFKTLTFGKLPKCLCLHIPRTTWSTSGMPIKRDDPVIFSEFLILDPFTYAETKKRSAKVNSQTMAVLNNGKSIFHGRHKYKLDAVIEHLGPVDSGHFVCYRRGNRPGQWLYTSDVTVQDTSLEDVLNASPYLLFYERIISLHD